MTITRTPLLPPFCVVQVSRRPKEEKQRFEEGRKQYEEGKRRGIIQLTRKPDEKPLATQADLQTEAVKAATTLATTHTTRDQLVAYEVCTLSCCKLDSQSSGLALVLFGDEEASDLGMSPFAAQIPP